MASKEELLQIMSDYVFDMEDELIVDVCNQYIEAGYEPQDGIMLGLVDGMLRASKMFEEGEYYLPEIIVCSDAMTAGIDIMRANMASAEENSIGRVLIGTIEGDTHDIGKNLVKIMMETAGISVVDLGRDVHLDQFVDYVRDNEVDIVAMSSLMTTTMPGMAAVIKQLEEQGLRDKVKVMVGGAPVSAGFAKEIGADGYSTDAVAAVAKAKELLGVA